MLILIYFPRRKTSSVSWSRTAKKVDCLSFSKLHFANLVFFKGVPMVPVGWQEMQCPKSYVKELRKVARVCPEKADAENMEVADR